MMFARVLLMAAALIAPVAATAQDATTYAQFLARYRCPVMDRLERIYAAGDPATHPDEYLIVETPPYAEAYVQCIFRKTEITCEAASGFYRAAPGQSRSFHLPAPAIAALGRLGFSTDDSNGNFRIDLDLADPPNFNAVAELMLQALYDAYGARAKTILRFKAPYAPAAPKCAMAT